MKPHCINYRLAPQNDMADHGGVCDCTVFPFNFIRHEADCLQTHSLWDTEASLTGSKSVALDPFWVQNTAASLYYEIDYICLVTQV